MIYQYKRLIDVDPKTLKEKGIELSDYYKYIPSHLREDKLFKSNYLVFWIMKALLFMLGLSVRVFLSPRKEKAGSLDPDEVENVYSREANNYDWKHHLTTRGIDTIWRRLAGYCAVTYARVMNKKIKILDICTGTGPTVVEIANLLDEYCLKAEIIGLDFNERMLNKARERKLKYQNIICDFVKGDATDLTTQSETTDLAHFLLNSFDIVTQMCGIGGISKPLNVFQSVIKVLKPGGIYFMADMHRPIPNQPGEMPIFIFSWLKSPFFEALAYESTTIPLVLNKLWGWRDPTLDFYSLPFITYQDDDGICWGFEVISFETESQRWWLGITVMPYAKITVKKVEISFKEMETRKNILSLFE